MIAYTSSLEFAQRVLPDQAVEWTTAQSELRPDLRPALADLFDARPLYCAPLPASNGAPYDHLCLTPSTSRSQFDVLVDLSRRDALPALGLFCVAGEGEGFHGMRERPWVAPAGNLYVSVFLPLGREIEHSGVAYTVLGAVSVLDAIDRLPGLQGRAGIKWPNDILIDGSKVAGVLAHSQVHGKLTSSVILGIGLNVETTPSVEPTAFVPRVARLADFAPCSQRPALASLMDAISRNHQKLLDGRYHDLLDSYRARSIAIGHQVVVQAESGEELGRGRVESIGADLGLALEGSSRPLAHGRLILPEADTHALA